jgi:DNA-binding IclR family transcriptional regulator
VAYDISCRTGLGTNVAERRGGVLFYILHYDGQLAPRSYTLIGKANPLHATALGKCLLSELSTADQSELFAAAPLLAYTPNTIVERAVLSRELAVVRERGYAIEREELGFGRACLAAPIRGRGGAVVAAFSVSGPLSALALDEREPELVRIAVEAADRISIAIGAPHARPIYQLAEPIDDSEDHAGWPGAPHPDALEPCGAKAVQAQP